MKLHSISLACFCLATLAGPLFGSIVTNHSYESDAGLGPGFHAGAQPTDMDATGIFGDQDPNVHFGVFVDSSLARTGQVGYFLDLGNNGGGNGFGGNFSVSRFDAPAGRFGRQSNFTMSAWIAENPADLPTNAGGNLHFEFYDGSGRILFRTDSFGLASGFPSGTDNGDATPDYSQVTNSYTLGEAITNGRNAHPNSTQGATPITDSTLAQIVSARAVITGNNGGNTFDGQYFVDDFSFIANIPEPSSSLLLCAALASLTQRRKRNI